MHPPDCCEPAAAVPPEEAIVTDPLPAVTRTRPFSKSKATAGTATAEGTAKKAWKGSKRNTDEEESEHFSPR